MAKGTKGRSSPAKAKKVVASPPLHPKYEDMIRDAIVTLKERKGSSRHAIKKYILTTYKLPDISITSSRIRLAINKGVDKGIFSFPNGPSGTIKLVKKETAKKEKKETEKKEKPKKTEKKEVKPKTVTVTKSVRKAPTERAVTNAPTKKAPPKPKKASTSTMKTRSSTANTASEKRTGTRKKAASS